MLCTWLGGKEEDAGDGVLVMLYGKVFRAISELSQNGKNCITVMVDDISLMEVATKGSTSLVLDFLHYCHTLTLEFVSSLFSVSRTCMSPFPTYLTHSF